MVSFKLFSEFAILDMLLALPAVFSVATGPSLIGCNGDIHPLREGLLWIPDTVNMRMTEVSILVVMLGEANNHVFKSNKRMDWMNSESVIRRCSVKKVLLKISKN